MSCQLINIIDRSVEYANKCSEIFNKGGKLWVIERSDSNKFLSLNLEKSINYSAPKYIWSNELSFFSLFYLCKEDAVNAIEGSTFREGGCACCGNGSSEIPVKITEHIFDSK